MVEILPLSLWMLDVGITIIPRVYSEAALVAGVDDAHCHGYEGVVGGLSELIIHVLTSYLFQSTSLSLLENYDVG